MPSKKGQNQYGYGYFHGVGSNYPRAGYENFGHSDFRYWTNFVVKSRGKRLKWLDVGCAYGFLVNYALEAGIDAWGVDVSKYAIKEGKRLFPNLSDRLFVYDCDDLLMVFKKEFFDVVSMLEVVEHLPNPKQSLAMVARILKKGGYLIISTPNGALRIIDRDVTHISIKPAEYWVESLTEIGFKVKIQPSLFDPIVSLVRFLARNKFLAQNFLQLKWMPNIKILAIKC